ncbi:MAG: metallophosphoesterase [Thermoprotei archaeon]|nr:MAG: metallophosphoesterase [Thermoprotei archaeon]
MLSKLGLAMKVVVISDSHDNQEAVEQFLKEIREVEFNMLIHAGDIISPFTLKKFTGFPFYGVYGNNDGERQILSKIARENNMVLEEQPLFIEKDGYRIVIVHGVGGSEKTKKLVEALGKSGLFDLVVYGHLHIIDVQKIGDTIVLNPGTLAGYLAEKKTYAIVDLDKKIVEIREL